MSIEALITYCSVVTVSLVYRAGSCSADGIANDRSQLQCYNGRCISMSLRCDRFFSDNCGDYGDVRASPPGNCTTGTRRAVVCLRLKTSQLFH